MTFEEILHSENMEKSPVVASMSTSVNCASLQEKPNDKQIYKRLSQKQRSILNNKLTSIQSKILGSRKSTLQTISEPKSQDKSSEFSEIFQFDDIALGQTMQSYDKFIPLNPDLFGIESSILKSSEAFLFEDSAFEPTMLSLDNVIQENPNKFEMESSILQKELTIPRLASLPDKCQYIVDEEGDLLGFDEFMKPFFA